MNDEEILEQAEEREDPGPPEPEPEPEIQPEPAPEPKPAEEEKPKVKVLVFIKARRIRPENAAGFLYWAKMKFGDQHKETIPDWLSLYEVFQRTPAGR
jgi:hypothetical protein